MDGSTVGVDPTFQPKMENPISRRHSDELYELVSALSCGGGYPRCGDQEDRGLQLTTYGTIPQVSNRGVTSLVLDSGAS